MSEYVRHISPRSDHKAVLPSEPEIKSVHKKRGKREVEGDYRDEKRQWICYSCLAFLGGCLVFSEVCSRKEKSCCGVKGSHRRHRYWNPNYLWLDRKVAAADSIAVVCVLPKSVQILYFRLDVKIARRRDTWGRERREKQTTNAWKVWHCMCSLAYFASSDSSYSEK